MVLELKEYTMASLGYKSSENLLISVNQTHLTSHNIKKGRRPPPFHRSPSVLSSPSLSLSPATVKAAANGDGGGGSHRSFLLSFPQFTFPKPLPFHLLRPSRYLRPPSFVSCPFPGDGRRRTVKV